MKLVCTAVCRGDEAVGVLRIHSYRKFIGRKLNRHNKYPGLGLWVVTLCGDALGYYRSGRPW
jgi:hypothetical protein